MSLAGHYWTLSPLLKPLPAEPPSVPWSLTVGDPDLGPIRLTGRWSGAPLPGGGGSREAVVLLHGISGSAESRYCRLGAAAARSLGMACLRLNLRGADGLGEDYYHAGLTADLEAALACPELAPYDRRYLLGYSLGGHLSLLLATAPGGGTSHGDGARVRALSPPGGPVAGGRLAGVAAVCSPLDLAACQREFDRPQAALYRSYVMRGLKRLYAAVAERRPVPLPVERARRLRLLQEWDDRVVAPRWGFAGAADYYARTSVGPRLGRLALPALLVAAEDDPMVPASTLTPVLERPGAAALEVRWLPGAGHLGFPNGLRLDGGREGGGVGGRGGRSALRAARERLARLRRQPPEGDAAPPWSEEQELGLDLQVLRWLRDAGGA